jgi:hypothetical protein
VYRNSIGRGALCRAERLYHSVIANELRGIQAQLITQTRKNGAGGRTRTDMSLRTPDFESGAYTNFATPAARGKIISRALRKSQPEIGRRFWSTATCRCFDRPRLEAAR